jgi:hypothetical protein
VLDEEENFFPLEATLQVTPESYETQITIAVYEDSGGSHTGITTISLCSTGDVSAWKSFFVITGMLSSLAIFLFGLSWLNNHHVIS